MKQAPVNSPMYNKAGVMEKSWRSFFADLFYSSKSVVMPGRSSDPADPAKSSSVMWLSDGTGTGSDGDIMIKITDTSGTTKTGTLVDFSTL